jgi:hypothetical protein
MINSYIVDQFSCINTKRRNLPVSFSNLFSDITNADELQNDYNYIINPAIRKSLENFRLKQILFNWNSLDIELKATADAA